MSQGTILIIGGGGKTGARVNARLRARGIATRSVSRSTETPFDWERPEGWAAAFDGIARAYVTYQPDLIRQVALVKSWRHGLVSERRRRFHS